MPKTSKTSNPDQPNIPPWRLQLALLARGDEELRGYIQRAGACAEDVRRQIRRAADVRPVHVRGRPEAKVHLMAMPALIDFGESLANCPAESRLVSPGSGAASRLQVFWQAVLGGRPLEVLLLPRAVLLEAVLGISPTAVNEFVFHGASLMEGTRTKPVRMRPADNCARQAGRGLVATYLLMALIADAEEPVFDEAAWHRHRADAEALVRALFATNQLHPTVTLLQPHRLFDAIDAAQTAQLVHAVAWISRHNGLHSLALRTSGSGLVEIECAYQLPDIERAGRMVWAYDGSWREPPDLGEIARRAVPTGKFDAMSLKFDARPRLFGGNRSH